MPPKNNSLPRISSNSALAQLRAFIAKGGYEPGMKLPSEAQLCRELGLRRAELRRALETLDQGGELWRHVGKGTFLSEPPEESDPNGLISLAKTVSPADVMRARAALEPAITREAVLNASATALATLRLTAKRIRNANTWREYEALDNEFHRQIAAASGSLILLSLFDHLNALRRMVAWGSALRKGSRPPEDYTSFDEHDQIVVGLVERDQDAAIAAMRAHLRSVSDRVFP